MQPSRLGHRLVLLDPRVLLATAVLVFNDFVLKPAAPGFVTGKLSDVAGLIVLPLLVISVIGRGRRRETTTIALIALWFSAIQVSAQASSAHEQLFGVLFGSVRDNVADPTDLLALPALAVAVLILRNPRPLRATKQARLFALLAACLACTASLGSGSLVEGPAQLTADGDIEILIDYQQTTGDGDDYLERIVSTDGGLNYQDAGLPPGIETEWDLFGWFEGESEGCLTRSPKHCFRIEEPFSILETDDGGRTWRSSWKNATDNYLLRADLDRLQPDSQAPSVLVLDDDTVIVTTGIGQTLRWTPSRGWDLNARAARNAKLNQVLIIGALALISITFSSQRKGNLAHGLLTTAGVLGVGLPAYALFSQDGFFVILAVFACAVAIGLFVAGLVAWHHDRKPLNAKDAAWFLVPGATVIAVSIAVWYFGARVSIGVPLSAAGLGIGIAAASNIAMYATSPAPLPPAGSAVRANFRE